MPFTRNSLSEIIDRIISDFQTRITGATSLLRRSSLNVIAKINGGAFHLLYEYLDYQARQLFIATADQAGLEAIASEYGITRTAAAKATGTGVIGTSTNGKIIPAETELQSTDGQVYITDADQTVASGTAILNFTASVAGADGNDDGGITLSFISPIAGVSTSVTVDTDGISGGADEGGDTSLRERLLIRKRQPPHGGAAFDYKTWALEVSGVTRAWTIPLYQGVGTIGVAFVRDDDDNIIPNATQRDAMKAYIISHTDPGTGETVGMPVTAALGLFIISLSLVSVNFDISIFPNTTAVQNAIQANLEDLILQEGGPGEILYISRISEAISLATDEVKHKLNFPIADVSASILRVPVLGEIIFGSY